MEIVIENLPNLNAPAPAPEDTVAAEALVTNIDRLADESPNEAAPAVPAATVPATAVPAAALAANEAAEANPEPAAATAEAVPATATEATEAATAATSATTESRAIQATSRPATYMPLTSADKDGASKPIFLSRIRPGFWDIPEIAFD